MPLGGGKDRLEAVAIKVVQAHLSPGGLKLGLHKVADRCIEAAVGGVTIDDEGAYQNCSIACFTRAR